VRTLPHSESLIVFTRPPEALDAILARFGFISNGNRVQRVHSSQSKIIGALSGWNWLFCL
jgi:hypothetical protein